MQNIDGLGVKPQKSVKKQIQITSRKTAGGISIHKQKQTAYVRLFSFFDKKQLATIAVTFVLTFIFSIATSQGLAAFEYPVAGSPTPATPANYGEVTLSVISTPDTVPAFDPNVLGAPGKVYLPEENISLPDPLQQRKEFLEQYLRAKGSPLADHVDAISEQSQWKLIIAISRAESSFCKHEVHNNCWGIGGAWNMKNYKDFDQAVADVNKILEQHYIQAGLETPKEIEKKYVGYPDKNWEEAVQEELDNLANVQ